MLQEGSVADVQTSTTTPKNSTSTSSGSSKMVVKNNDEVKEMKPFLEENKVIDKEFDKPTNTDKRVFLEKIINTLKKENIDQAYIKRGNRSTPFFNIVLTYGGDRTILDERTPSEEFLEIGSVNPKYFYLTGLNGNWEKAYEEIFRDNPDSLFAFNPGSRQLGEGFEKTLEILPKIEILFVNLGEAQKIVDTKETDIKLIMTKLKESGVRIAVVTDGINGSYSIDKNGKIFHINPITKDKPIERTGAGDSYAAGFLYAVISGKRVEEAMKYGAVNADSVIKKVGAQDGLLTKEEMEQNIHEKPEFKAIEI
jgi:sugar/nucleoside kinase (ribokinase family)